MNRKMVAAALVCTALSSPAFAQQDAAPGTADEAAQDEASIIVTAARTILPPNALPLTIDIIGKDILDQQLAISGSVTDAVSNLTPSFSPTRQKLSGAGETLRGRSPLYAINGIPQSTPLRDGGRDGFTIDGFFIDRVELIYGSNALQGIGGTGGIVNQVTVGAPKQDGLSGRVSAAGHRRRRVQRRRHGRQGRRRSSSIGRGVSTRPSARRSKSAALSTMARAAASAST